MAWKENKDKTLWADGGYSIVKKPLNERKWVYHLYLGERYLAYSHSLAAAQERARAHFAGLQC